jgi:ATP-dependent Clp protease ATP-binding subunit ClpA/ATP-dependent Clp protease ATP-binding subunit ClpC
MQLLSMRVADGELRLDRQVLREAPALAVNWVLLPLLELPRAALVDRLDHLGRRVQLLASSDELVSLSERLFSDLRALNLGDASRADSVYDLDAMRASLNAYLEELEGIVRAEGDDAERYERLEAERFGWVTRVAPYAGIRRHRLFDRRAVAWSGKRVGAEELLSRIAEGYELLRSVALVDDPRQHSVVVELSRVGELSEKRRFEGRSPGLLEELVGAYLAEAGGHSSWVMTLRDGSEVRGRGAQDRGLERVVEADRFEMSVVRPCALDTFALETGVHVWHRPRGPELVAVRVRSALDEAVVGGEGKGELPPVVRTLRFEPPVRASALAPMEVEDFAMAFAEAFPARRLRDALEPLWLMRRAGWDGGTQ